MLDKDSHLIDIVLLHQRSAISFRFISFCSWMLLNHSHLRLCYTMLILIVQLVSYCYTHIFAFTNTQKWPRQAVYSRILMSVSIPVMHMFLTVDMFHFRLHAYLVTKAEEPTPSLCLRSMDRTIRVCNVQLPYLFHCVDIPCAQIVIILNIRYVNII